MGDLKVAAEAAAPLPQTTNEMQVDPGCSTIEAREAPLQSYPAPFNTAPPDAVVQLVAAHLKAMLPGVLSEVEEWTAKQRLRAARLLLTIVTLVENEVVQFADSLLATLRSTRLDDDAHV